jgi:hypothetical protein
VQPGGERGIPTEQRELFEGGQEHLLRHLLRFTLVPKEVEGEGVDPVLVPLDEFGEGGAVATRRERRELAVRRRSPRRHRHALS